MESLYGDFGKEFAESFFYAYTGFSRVMRLMAEGMDLLKRLPYVYFCYTQCLLYNLDTLSQSVLRLKCFSLHLNAPPVAEW